MIMVMVMRVGFMSIMIMGGFRCCGGIVSVRCLSFCDVINLGFHELATGLRRQPEQLEASPELLPHLRVFGLLLIRARGMFEPDDIRTGCCEFEADTLAFNRNVENAATMLMSTQLPVRRSRRCTVETDYHKCKGSGTAHKLPAHSGVP